jgi:hypothetical protein
VIASFVAREGLAACVSARVCSAHCGVQTASHLSTALIDTRFGIAAVRLLQGHDTGAQVIDHEALVRALDTRLQKSSR